MDVNEPALPENIEIHPHGSNLEVSWKWPRPHPLVIGVGLLITWKIATHLGLDMIHQNGAFDALVQRVLDEPFPFNLFEPVFALGILWAVYFIIAQMVNRTHITVSRARIVVRHGPLPWLGERDIETSSIKQIFTKINLSGNSSRSGKLFAPYDLLALDRDGETITLLCGLNLAQEQALYLEQRIERHLGIKNAQQHTADVANESAEIDGLDSASEEMASDIRRPVHDSVLQIHRGAQLTISKRWFTTRHIGQTIFAVAWIIFAAGFAWAWLTKFGHREVLPIQPEPADVIPLINLSIGIVLLYCAIAGMLNRTELKVSRETVSVRHSPIPWRGNGELALSIVQAFEVQRASWGRGPKGGPYVYKHELHAKLRDGKTKKLIGGFDTTGDALSVQHEMERYLRS